MKYMYNKSKIILCLVLLSYSINIEAQKSINAGGSNVTTDFGSISYSIGQVFYTNLKNDYGTIIQGVQQPYEIFSLGKDEFPQITLNLSIYPNPTTSLVYLKINADNLYGYGCKYQLYDITGKLLLVESITDRESEIKMEHLPSNCYFLSVLQDYKIIKTFKIIKK